MTTVPSYDPRPVLEVDGPRHVVAGRRCSSCRYPVTAPLDICPLCGGEMTVDHFGPDGTVSASTCLYVRIPGRTPPYAVAYLDLDDGPRVLVHTEGRAPATPGERLRITAKNEFGDLTAEPVL